MDYKQLHKITMVAIFLGINFSTHADTMIRNSSSFYFVKGNSALVLMRQFAEKGPEDHEGKRRIAYVQWEIQWKIKYNKTDKSCQPREVTTIVGVSTSRPKWQGFGAAPESLKSRWKEMQKAVDNYSDFHKELARKAAKTIERQITDITPQKSCDLIESRASRLADETITLFTEKGQKYDLDTKYGKENGLTLL